MNKNVAVIIGVIVVALVAYILFTRTSTPAEDSTSTDTSSMMMDDTDDVILGDDMMDAAPTTSSVPVAASANPAAPTAGQVKEFTVTGSNFKFDMAQMQVNQGDTVKITLKNQGGAHDLKVDGYNVGTKVIQTGEQETFQFVADKAGQFEYYCSVGTHRQMGMKGTLTVN